jgi:methyl-accepting chemotaxis protein
MSNQQAAVATEQNTAITQTMATVEEVRQTVAQTAQQAQDVAADAEQSVTVTRSGQQAVVDTMTGMTTVQERVESIAENILLLSEQTQQIGTIISTVTDLADRSKLLALNASIEAARAGEEGRGFAVVAMEVRQLAEQSSQATEQIRDILEDIQRATNTAVMVTEEGSKEAQNGLALVSRAGEAIEELTGTVDRAARAAALIAASARQQRNGMEQLATAMQTIGQTGEQVAQSASQGQHSAAALNDLAGALEALVREDGA